MRPASPEADRSEAPRPAAGRRTRRWRVPRLGVGSRLALGLAAVAAVLVAGELLATRTSREALAAVRSMQNEHEPLASRASAVLVRLVDYDRAVGAFVQARNGADFAAISSAGAMLEDALGSYFDGTPGAPATPAARELRAALSRHIANGRLFASRAAQRAEWVEERRAALDDVYQRITVAGGSGLAINGTEVIARRSLAELQSAIDDIRGNADSSSVARRERDFSALLRAHAADLQSSPGSAWLTLMQQDFADAVRLRRAVERYDQTSDGEWRRLIDESATLANQVQELLQKPARRGLLQAAQHAQTAAELAERTLAMSGAAVLALLLLVSVLLTASISLPVRRLTAATRRLAGGDRAARAPRGGSAEIDELAESFNTMAVALARAEEELRAHHTELERHVDERTRALHHLAHHDPLTQLPNRRQLSARLDLALAAAGARHKLGLLFVDVDNFKSINDTLGHNFGDRVLQHIAGALRSAIGGAGLLARLGGDEFTVLLEDVSSGEEVALCANRIVSTLHQPLTVDGRMLTTSASVGGSLYPDHAADADGLLRAADVALFRAKELGRNRFVPYSPELYAAAAQGFRLEQALRRAVEGGELLLLFQPMVTLLSFETMGLEALLRWRRPDGRIAAANEFIPAAEKSGLIRELTGWVLRSAAATAAGWRAQGWQHACVSVNVSPPQFFESDFVEQVARTLEVTGLPASALELEITETVVQTGNATIESLKQLRALGVSIALDDFGMGYSSLTSLEQLPIARVKLDRLLVAGVDSNPRSAAIVRSIVALCQSLGLQVVAEGVERAAQLEFLAQCGPVGVQGYLLGQPVEALAAAAEARAAAERTRRALESTRASRLEADHDRQVLIGGSGRWRVP